MNYLFFLHSFFLLIITTIMHNIKLFKVGEIPRLILTLFDVCRIEEELGDKARFAGKNFRKPIWSGGPSSVLVCSLCLLAHTQRQLL